MSIHSCFMPVRRFFSRRTRVFGFLSTFATILAIILAIIFAVVFVLHEVSYNIPLREGSSAAKITFLTNFISIDSAGGTLTTDWYPSPVNCSLPETIVNIFVDRNLLSSNGDLSAQSASDDPPPEPFFRFSTSRSFSCNPDPRTSYPIFRTVSKVIGFSRSKNRSGGSSLQSYPFDTYFSQIYLFAQTNGTKENVGIALDEPSGTLVNFKVSLDASSSFNNAVDGLYIVLNISRSGAVRTLVIFICLANWLVTIAFIWITVAGVIWPEQVVKEMFALPIAALFAFTTVRANLPGAPPGFGATMDFLAILPNIALMTLCTGILLFVILYRRAKLIDRKSLKKTDEKEDSMHQYAVNALEASQDALASAREAVFVAKEALTRAQFPPLAKPTSQQEYKPSLSAEQSDSTAPPLANQDMSMLQYSTGGDVVSYSGGAGVPDSAPGGMAVPTTNQMPWNPYDELAATTTQTAAGAASEPTDDVLTSQSERGIPYSKPSYDGRS